MTVKHLWILWTALIVAVLFNLSWKFLQDNVSPFLSENYGFTVHFYYVPFAVVHLLLSLFIFVNAKRYLVTFLYLGLTFNNLADELFFNPTKTQLNEFVFGILIISFGFYRQTIIRRDSKINPNDIDSDNNHSYEADNRK